MAEQQELTLEQKDDHMRSKIKSTYESNVVKINKVKGRWAQMLTIYGDTEEVSDLSGHIKTYYPHLHEFYMKNAHVF
jgi:hypothetical protein